MIAKGGHKTLNRLEAIEAVGLNAIEAVEYINCDYTNTLTNNDTVEFKSSIRIGDIILSAYYYPTQDELDDINWIIHHYEVI